MMVRLALITGASAGLGEQLAYEFARRHLNLVLVGRQRTKLERVARQAARLTRGKVAILAVDLLEEGQAQFVWQRCVQHCGVPDVLVNSTALSGFGTVAQQPQNAGQRVLRLNTLVPLTLSQYFIRMHQHDPAASFLINIASAGAELTLPYSAFHSASKAALLGFARGSQFELARTRIHLVTVLPTLLNTGHFAQVTAPDLKPWPLLVKLVAKQQLAPKKVARKIVRQTFHGAKILRLPLPYQMVANVNQILPDLSYRLSRLIYQ